MLVVEPWWVKPEEKLTSVRPFIIYWHGVFLRSYDNIIDLENNVKFYKSFLLCITTGIYKDKEK